MLGSRAMTYDATMGMDSTPPTPVIDRGISRPLDVTNFVANTFSRVQGVGINFDGELNAVKGDSTYLFDRTLRLQGILQSRPTEFKTQEKLAQLWLHESERVYGDRLVSLEDLGKYRALAQRQEKVPRQFHATVLWRQRGPPRVLSLC